MKIYWVAIALFYFILACLSFYFSLRFSTDFKNQYKKLSFNIGGKPFLKYVVDYLSISTWVNVGGFLLAGFAALIS